MPPIMNRFLVEALVEAFPASTKLPAVLKDPEMFQLASPEEFGSYVANALEHAIFAIIDCTKINTEAIVNACVHVCVYTCLHSHGLFDRSHLYT